MQAGLKQVVSAPLKTAQLSFEVIEISETVANYVNPNSITDVGVGAHCTYTGVIGGIYNFLINLKDIKDENFNYEMRNACGELKDKSQKKLDGVLNIVEGKL
jgi:glutamate formiminotransferase/formiminotetrahydrofolate cyclodeaminase